MFILKNKNNEYFARHTNSENGNKTGYWTEYLDVKYYNMPTFETEKEAEEYIAKTPFFEHEPKPDIIEVKQVEKYYEVKNPDVTRACMELEDKLLSVRNHKDAVSVLLSDDSLVHDMNAASGYVARKIEAAGLSYSNKEAFGYSDTISKMCYRNEDGNFRPNGENNHNRLSFRARRAATFFATMADALLLLEKYEEKANKARKKNNND